jgi:hypothetical protein
MRNTLKTLLPAALTIIVAAGHAIAAPVTIADLAPKQAAFVIGVDNFAATKAAFDKTGMRKAWDDKRTQDFIQKNLKKEMDEMVKAFEDSGIKLDELDPPSGPVGSAFWINWNAKDKKSEPRAVSFGDWGDKADATAKQIEEAIAQAEKKKDITVKEDDYKGSKLWLIEIVEKPDAKKPAAGGAKNADGEEEMAEDEDMLGEDASGPGPMDLKNVVYARAGSHLLMTTDVETMEKSIDRIAGTDADSVGDNADFTAVIKQLETPQGYAVFLPGAMTSFMTTLVEESKAGTPGVDPSLANDPNPGTVMTALGLAGVKGVGTGIKFDTEGGMMEQSFSIFCPDKKGIMTLFAGADQKFTAPAFANADAASVTLLQFKFADLLGVLTEGAKSLPPEFGDTVVQNIQQAQLMAGPILTNLGPQVWLVQSYAKPLSATSSQTLVAIACKDAAQFNTSLQNLGGMLPIQSRDFQGNQIWSMAGGGMIPGMSDFSLGVGFGHVFIGQNAMVENAMRSAGNPDAASLNKEPRFTTAMRSAAASGLAFGWTDMKQALEFTDWTIKNPDKMVEAQMKGMFGDDPDAEQYKKEMIEEAKKNQPAWLKDIPMDVLIREAGDAVFEFHVVPEGLKGRSLWLRPAK